MTYESMSITLLSRIIGFLSASLGICFLQSVREVFISNRENSLDAKPPQVQFYSYAANS